MSDLEGALVTDVREMTDEEISAEYYHPDNHHTPKQIVLAENIRLFPSADPEGNSSGFFVGLKKDELIGTTYIGGRELSAEEFERLGWRENAHSPPTVLCFEEEDSNEEYAVVPACDPEQNGPGAVFGRDNNEAFRLETRRVTNPEDDSEAVGSKMAEEILESETEAEQHGLYARLTRWKDDQYAVEISMSLQSGGHEDQWGLVGGSVGYDSSVFDTEGKARNYFEDLTSLSHEEMWAKYGDEGLWVTA